jgi:6,7-dimethyl-8-ribityllumazine synthase
MSRKPAVSRLTQSHLSERRIAYVQASWHEDVLVEGRRGFATEWKARGFAVRDIDDFSVPGAFEIPLHAQRLARTGRYAAVIAAAFVVDGGIYRHEFVADAVIKGLMQVQLETGVPVLSLVLTPHHFHAHEEHRKFFHDHFRVKGREAAAACAATVASLAALAD